MDDELVRKLKGYGIVPAPAEWKDSTKHYATTNLHALQPAHLNSASGVEQLQYASFRALWKFIRVNKFDAAIFGSLDTASAEAVLDRHEPWARYIDAIEAEKPARTFMGVFGMVLMNRRQACGAVGETTRPRIINTVPRTRRQVAEAARVAAAAAAAAASRAASALDTPIVARAAPATAADDDDPFVELDSNAGAGPASAALVTPQRGTSSSGGGAAANLTPYTPASNKQLGLVAFPQIDDENVVNKALVDLLQALVMVGYEAEVGLVWFGFILTLKRA
jgi:hypothetical protein